MSFGRPEASRSILPSISFAAICRKISSVNLGLITITRLASCKARVSIVSIVFPQAIIRQQSFAENELRPFCSISATAPPKAICIFSLLIRFGFLLSSIVINRLPYILAIANWLLRLSFCKATHRSSPKPLNMALRTTDLPLKPSLS